MNSIKITIDTKEDSPEDIRKVVALLSSLLARGVEKRRNIFEDSSPGLDIFDQRSPTRETSQATDSDVSNAFTSLFGDSSSEKKPEKKEEIEIVPY